MVPVYHTPGINWGFLTKKGHSFTELLESHRTHSFRKFRQVDAKRCQTFHPCSVTYCSNQMQTSVNQVNSYQSRWSSVIIYIVYLFWSFLGGSINPVANHPLVHNPISVHWTCAFEPWFSKETWWFSMGQTHVGPSYKGCWKWIGGSSVYVHHCLALSVSWCNSWYNSWLLDAPFIYIYIYIYIFISINIHQ